MFGTSQVEGSFKSCFKVEPRLRGSWDLVTGVIIKVTTLITPLRVLITLLTKSHDPPRRVHIHYHYGIRYQNHNGDGLLGLIPLS